jgi:hypothetical protein
MLFRSWEQVSNLSPGKKIKYPNSLPPPRAYLTVFIPFLQKMQKMNDPFSDIVEGSVEFKPQDLTPISGIHLPILESIKKGRSRVASPLSVRGYFELILMHLQVAADDLL